jgi:transposase-like protein
MNEDGPDDDALEHEAEASLDDSYEASCPYCGAENTLIVDLGGGDSQSYIEDCQVCCRPLQVHVAIDDAGHVSLGLEGEDE